MWYGKPSGDYCFNWPMTWMSSLREEMGVGPKPKPSSEAEARTALLTTYNFLCSRRLQARGINGVSHSDKYSLFRINKGGAV